MIIIFSDRMLVTSVIVSREIGMILTLFLALIPSITENLTIIIRCPISNHLPNKQIDWKINRFFKYCVFSFQKLFDIDKYRHPRFRRAKYYVEGKFDMDNP